MTAPIAATRDSLRAALPELAAFIDELRAEFGPQVRVQGVRAPGISLGDLTQGAPGIPLSQCTAVGRITAPDADAEPSGRRKR